MYEVKDNISLTVIDSLTYLMLFQMRIKEDSERRETSYLCSLLVRLCNRARLIVNDKELNGKWVVSFFEPAHNHRLFPEHVRYMRVHQKLPLSVRVLL